MRSKRKLVERLLAGAISASLILPLTGCRGEVVETPPSAVEQVTPTQAPVQAQPTPEAAAVKIDDNGKPIADFDEFVNGQWLKEKEKAASASTTATWEYEDMIEERLEDILENTDISGLSDKDGLAKVIRFYNEAVSMEDMEKRIKGIREYISAIAGIKSLDELYKLSATEEYSIYVTLTRFVVQNGENGDNTEVYAPYSYTEEIQSTLDIITGDEKPADKEALLAYWKELGYSEERLKEIADNALEVADVIDEYYKNVNYSTDLLYWDQDHLDKKGLKVPVIDILRELKAYGRYEEFLAPETMIEMLNTMYTEDNLKMLCDNYIYSAAMDLYSLSAYKAYFSGEDEDREEYEHFVRQFLIAVAGDVLAEEYMNRYLEDGMYENAEILADEIKNELMSVLGEADWMGENSRRALKAKIARMSYFLGSNGHVNDLTDYDISGDLMEDIIKIKVDYKRFMRSQAKYEDDKRQPFQVDLLQDNGQYFRKSNMFVLCTGTLVYDCMKNDAVYEERLAQAGVAIAHEMSHTLTPDSIYYDEQGYYKELLNEDEYAALWEKAGAIAEFFDGMEIADGNKISGWRVEDETFADLMGMRVCLNLLAKQEDPDYDLFFRKWAERRAFYLSEEDMDNALTDGHLIGKFRINYVLGQFDIFYETYDIDENSPYYVPEGKRLTTY